MSHQTKKTHHVAIVVYKKTDLRLQDQESVYDAMQELNQQKDLKNPTLKRILLPVYLMPSTLHLDSVIHDHPDGLRARCQEGLYWRGLSQLSDSFKKCGGNLLAATYPLELGLEQHEQGRKCGKAQIEALEKIMKFIEEKIFWEDLKAQKNPKIEFSLHIGKSYTPTLNHADEILCKAFKHERKKLTKFSSVSKINLLNTCCLYDVEKLPLSLGNDKQWVGHWGTIIHFKRACEKFQGKIVDHAKPAIYNLSTLSDRNGVEFFMSNSKENKKQIIQTNSFLLNQKQLNNLGLDCVDQLFWKEFINEGMTDKKYRPDHKFFNERKPRNNHSAANWIRRIYGTNFATFGGRFFPNDDSEFKNLTLANDFTESEGKRLYAEYLDVASNKKRERGTKRSADEMKGGIAIYEQHRSRIDLRASSTHLSVFLVFGLIGPKRFQYEIHRLWQTGKIDKLALKTFGRRLFWRDLAYFQMNVFPHSHTIGIRQHYDETKWRFKNEGKGISLLDRWRYGYTGYPLVDAGQRQLWQVGWSQQNVRMVAASFLVEYLRLDWKEGAKWYVETLLDHDPAINTMMWQNAGRSGIDAWNFVLNPVNGAARDPLAEYSMKWIPELRPITSQQYLTNLITDGYGGKGFKAAKVLDHFFNPTGYRKSIDKFAPGLNLFEIDDLDNDAKINRDGNLMLHNSTELAKNVYPIACILPNDLNNEQKIALEDVRQMRAKHLDKIEEHGYDIVTAIRPRLFKTDPEKASYTTLVFTKKEIRYQKFDAQRINTTDSGGKLNVNGSYHIKEVEEYDYNDQQDDLDGPTLDEMDAHELFLLQNNKTKMKVQITNNNDNNNSKNSRGKLKRPNFKDYNGPVQSINSLKEVGPDLSELNISKTNRRIKNLPFALNSGPKNKKIVAHNIALPRVGEGMTGYKAKKFF